MTVQLSVLTIVGYGPWTLTLGSDREHELQMLQASLYKEVQRLFSERRCLVFSNRADELIVLSNGLDLESHKAIQDTLISKFQNLRIRIAIGYGKTPLIANNMAHESISNSQNNNNNDGLSLRSESTLEKKDYMIFGSTLDAESKKDPLDESMRLSSNVTIMHMDIDGLGNRDLSPYDISLLMFGLYHKMSLFFYDYDSLAFFMGGDNFMIISSDSAKAAARKFVDMIYQQDGVKLNCGIGSAPTARDAACLATESLDMIRKMRDDPSYMSHVGENITSDTSSTKHPQKSQVYEHATKRHF